MKIKECMCENVNCVKEDTSIKDCAKIMGESHIGCCPVCDCSNNVVGILTDRDILLRSVAWDKDNNNTKAKDIMTKNVKTCTCNQEIEDAEKLMADERIRRIPVVNESNKVIGILTLGDLATNQDVYEEDLCDTIECICSSDDKNAQ